MIVWHVCGLGKLKRYFEKGIIKAPVNAWETIEEAKRFSLQTGRPFIIRLKFKKYEKLFGHKGKAVVSKDNVKIQGAFPYKSKFL